MPAGNDFLASYTHVSDVAAGLLAAYEAETLRHPMYHLGWGKNFSTAEVVRAVRAAVPKAMISVGPGTAPWTDHTRMRGPLAGNRLFEDAGFKPSLDLDRASPLSPIGCASTKGSGNERGQRTFAASSAARGLPCGSARRRVPSICWPCCRSA